MENESSAVSVQVEDEATGGHFVSLSLNLLTGQLRPVEDKSSAVSVQAAICCL